MDVFRFWGTPGAVFSTAMMVATECIEWELRRKLFAKERLKVSNAPETWAEVRQCLGVSLGSGGHSPELFESAPPVVMTPTF